jgi:hypothetical protein
METRQSARRTLQDIESMRIGTTHTALALYRGFFFGEIQWIWKRIIGRL